MSYELKIDPTFLGWQSGGFRCNKHKDDGSPFILEYKDGYLGGFYKFYYLKDDIHKFFIENNMKYSLTYPISFKNIKDTGLYVIFEDLESAIYFKMIYG